MRRLILLLIVCATGILSDCGGDEDTREPSGDSDAPQDDDNASPEEPCLDASCRGMRFIETSPQFNHAVQGENDVPLLSLGVENLANDLETRLKTLPFRIMADDDAEFVLDIQDDVEGGESLERCTLLFADGKTLVGPIVPEPRSLIFEFELDLPPHEIINLQVQCDLEHHRPLHYTSDILALVLEDPSAVRAIDENGNLPESWIQL